MRLLISLLIILSFIVGLGFWANNSLQASTQQLTEQIETVILEIKDSNWEAAARETAELESGWDKSARWWPVFLDHQEMDNIEFSLARVKAYVNSRDSALALGQLEELSLMLKHIPEKEALSIKNIL
jgi:predicted PurR-regulated permease PerM